MTSILRLNGGAWRCHASRQNGTTGRKGSLRTQSTQNPLTGIPLPNGAGIYYPFQFANTFVLYGPPNNSSQGFVISKHRSGTPNPPALVKYIPARAPVHVEQSEQEATLALYEGSSQLAEMVVYGTRILESEQALGDADYVFLLPMTVEPNYLPAPRDNDEDVQASHNEFPIAWSEPSLDEQVLITWLLMCANDM